MQKPETKRWLMDNHRFLKKPLFALVLLSAFLSTTAVLFAYFTKEVLDAAEARDARTFVVAGAIAVLIVLFQLLGNALNRYLQAYYKGLTDKHLKNKVYEDLLNVKNPVLEKHHSGTLMNHLTSDVEKVSDGMVEMLPRFVFLVLRFVFAFALLLFLDWVFAAIMLAAGLILFIGSLLIRGELKKRHHASQDAQARLRAYMQEGLENIPVIKSFEAETHTLNHLENRQQGYFKARLHKARLNVLTGSALNGFFAFGYVFALLFGAYRVTENIITFGSLVAILQLVNQIQMPFSGLSALLPKYYAMIASSDRLIAIERLDREAKPALSYDPSAFKRLVFDNVSFAYGKADVFEDLSFEVHSGEFVHIEGHSGIGKTTLFKLLLGLIDPDKGRITIEDGETYDVSPSTRGFFTYVPQNHLIFSGTIRENLLYNQKEKSDEDLEEVCKVSAIHDTIMAQPQGYDTVIGERGVGLSEGQIQRLAIARALLKDAPVLLLDEITSALDEATEAAVLQNIKNMTDKTCLIISHRPLDDGFIDKRIQLRKGGDSHAHD